MKIGNKKFIFKMLKTMLTYFSVYCVSCCTVVYVKLGSLFEMQNLYIGAGQEKPHVCIWPLNMNTEQNT